VSIRGVEEEKGGEEGEVRKSNPEGDYGQITLYECMEMP
jgi:hypothetical protein